MRSNATRLLHDDTGSAVATWFKAVFLTPFWFIPWLFPLGLICRLFNCEILGISFVFSFGFIYFVRDLLRKRIIIDEKRISCGLRTLTLEKITKVSVRKNLFGLERILRLEEAGGRELSLTMSKIPAEDFETLLEVLQRRAANSEIDSRVDSILRYKKWKPTCYQETTSTVSIDYHPNRGWENLPRHFGNSFVTWGRIVGPVGTLILALPIWLTLNTGSFKVIQDYSVVSRHQDLYDFLLALVNAWLAISGNVVMSAGALLWTLAAHPVALAVGLCIFLLLLGQLSHTFFSANRITMDSKELSLDRWGIFSSYNTGSVRWDDVTEVSVDVGHGETQVVFNLKHETQPFKIPLYAIDSVDAPRLLQALKRFAPQCTLSPKLIELLEPSAPKSYTQLWLQSLTAAPERKNLEPLKPGAMLDHSRYEVIRRLGVGGQGTAYLCYDLSRDEMKKATTVALKETIIPVFVESVVRQKTIEQFFSEVELLRSIDCDGVVKLLDHFVDDHRAYLVLEHIEGKTLRELVAEEGVFTPERARVLVLQMCEILEHLHGKNIIHRDFAPDNLMLTPEGTLKLIDFNVAQSVSDGSTDTIVGKHAYVPPEQFRGKPTSQSDIYALGATAYFLLTGEDPEPISQSKLPADVASNSTELSQLITECTRLSLSERLKSIQEVKSLIDAVPDSTDDADLDSTNDVDLDSTNAANLDLTNEAKPDLTVSSEGNGNNIVTLVEKPREMLKAKGKSRRKQGS